MLHRIHQKLGTAGFIISIVALIAALGGTALAAGGLTKSQEKQVTKIAKKYAGKPGTNGTNGTNGAPGATGPAGAKGDQGIQGIQGIQGVPGKNGTNGTPGQPWTAGGTLPSSATEGCPCTETGTWSAAPTGIVKLAIAPISFPIPLAQPLSGEKCFEETTPCQVHYIENGETTTECPGSVEVPTAEPGNLCVYDQQEAGAEAGSFRIVPPNHTLSGLPLPEQEGGGTSGALVVMNLPTENGWVFGTWAVTAP